MKIFKTRSSKLGQISWALGNSIDENSLNDAEKILAFLEHFDDSGDCTNMNYDSYNQYNTDDDKVIELGFNNIQNLSNWLNEVESLLTDSGIEAANLMCRWDTREILAEIRNFCE